ncbi:MAG: hypothetical protein Q8O67_10865 [Deltaproteobacteria bacterium]|nr:hypothetical protein [Deltaproteobacteria bacterium]
MAASIAAEALQLSLVGDVAGALALLRAARENAPLDEAALGLLFKLLGDAGPTDEVLALCAEGLALAKRPITTSTWHLRRGLLHLEARRRADAVKDLMVVLKLKVSDDQRAEAQKALLRAAELPKA